MSQGAAPNGGASSAPVFEFRPWVDLLTDTEPAPFSGISGTLTSGQPYATNYITAADVSGFAIVGLAINALVSVSDEPPTLPGLLGGEAFTVVAAVDVPPAADLVNDGSAYWPSPYFDSIVALNSQYFNLARTAGENQVFLNINPYYGADYAFYDDVSAPIAEGPHVVACIVDWTKPTALDRCRLFVDGIEVAASVHDSAGEPTEPTPFTTEADMAWLVGALGASQQPAPVIGYVAAWSRALTPAEILTVSAQVATDWPALAAP